MMAIAISSKAEEHHHGDHQPDDVEGG
jgi:hypothetical protein